MFHFIFIGDKQLYQSLTVYQVKMMKEYIYTLLIGLILLPMFAWSQHEFHKTWLGNSVANSTHLAKNESGGYAVISAQDDPLGVYPLGFTVGYYDSCDKLLWSKRFHDNDTLIICSDVIINKKGEILVAGSYQGSTSDAFLWKIDPSGQTIFFKKYGSPEQEYVYSIGELTGGGYFINGITSDGGSQNFNFILKLNESGEFEWSKRYFNRPIWGMAIATTDGGILTSSGSFHFKVDFKGNLQWAIDINDSKGYYESFPVEVSDGYVFARFSNSNVYDNTSHLFKLDFNGKVIWSGEHFNGALAMHLVELDNGHFITLSNNYKIGAAFSFAVLSEFDESGRLVKQVEKTTSPNFQYRSYDMVKLKNSDILIVGVEEGILDPTSHLYYSRTGSDLEFAGCAQKFTPLGTGKGNVVGVNVSVTPSSLNFIEINKTVASAEIGLDEFTLCEKEIEFGLDLGDDIIACKGSKLEISSNKNFPYYRWSTGETSKSIEINKAGIYILTVGNGCEEESDTIEVVFYPETNPEFIVSPVKTTPLEPVYFKSLNDSSVGVRWSYDGNISSERIFQYYFNRNGIHPIKYSITDQFGCIYEDSIDVLVDLVNVFVPNSFSPDFDGVNDDFGPIGFGIKNFHLVIYNRWGELIFEGENEPWNGMHDDLSGPISVYIYEIEVLDDFGKSTKYSGTVSVLK